MENAPEPVVIDPFKTLAELNGAHKIPCVFGKVPVEQEKPTEEDSETSDYCLDNKRYPNNKTVPNYD